MVTQKSSVFQSLYAGLYKAAHDLVSGLDAGLSVARVDSVSGNQLVVSGVDLVNGTPILDVKPYLPFCDSWPAASCPSWVCSTHTDRGP